MAALALVEQLQNRLLTENSATLTLERWCDEHHLGGPEPAHVRAERGSGPPLPPSDETRRALSVEAGEPVAFRHVRLSCNGLVLSDADNWYVPSRLTNAMNRTLDTTNEAFGHVVRELHFSRTTLSSRNLWQPLPADWFETPDPPRPAGAVLVLPPVLIENRAVLRRADNRPFSLVVERYGDAVLGFAPPPAR